MSPLAVVAALWSLPAVGLSGCSPGSMPRWFTPEPWRMPTEPAERAVDAAGREVPAGPLFMSVVEAVRLAFENNSGLRVRRLDPALARTEIEFERSAFDPLLSVSLGASGSREQNPGTFTSRNRGFDSTVELSQKLPPGTVWSLSYDWSQSDGLTSTTDHLGRVGLTVVQPLLRGFGRDANLTGIERAVRTYELSRFAFEQAAMDLATMVERAYWDLVQSQLDLVVQLELLTSARDRLEKNRKRIELGAKGVDEFDVVQDEAALSSRRESLLRLENSIEVQKLRLVRLIHPKGAEGYWRRTIQTYVPYLDPDRLPATPDPAATLRAALTDRPEIKAARIGEAISELDLRKARNDLLPQLDLTASWGYTGHAPTFARANRTALDGHYYDFDVSLQYSWSIGNRAAGSRHDRAELDKERSARTVEDVEQTVQADVRIALQQLDNAARRYRQAVENQALQRRKLDLARAAYEAGKPGFTLFFLIQFEDDLRNAAFLLNATIVEYLKALTDLRRAEGSILRVRGLKLD